tara:strand:+ start:1112 stop:1309 length:198 start_codon:yes stop_codon:yes gene_type:complete
MANIESLEDMKEHDYAIKALNELAPNALWVLRGWTYSDLEWIDKNKTKPTKEEFDTKIKKLKDAD